MNSVILNCIYKPVLWLTWWAENVATEQKSLPLSALFTSVDNDGVKSKVMFGKESQSFQPDLCKD